MAGKGKSKDKARAILLDLDATALSALLEQQGGVGELLEVSDGLVLRVSAQQEGRTIVIPVTLPVSAPVNALEATVTARKSTSPTAAQQMVLGFICDDAVVAESTHSLATRLDSLSLPLPDGQSGALSLFAGGSYVLQRVVLTHASAAPVKAEKEGKKAKGGKGGGKRK
ncbi:hypothetical protein ACFOKF_17905 [Sphingobium rhizovicinum]|uniref:Uncharacterized protein n=1 Tax=Sphingobium rhizovicinum TaxID=432308 RepID=A0ABV7NIP8_9SPHN